MRWIVLAVLLLGCSDPDRVVLDRGSTDRRDLLRIEKCMDSAYAACEEGVEDIIVLRHDVNHPGDVCTYKCRVPSRMDIYFQVQELGEQLKEHQERFFEHKQLKEHEPGAVFWIYPGEDDPEE